MKDKNANSTYKEMAKKKTLVGKKMGKLCKKCKRPLKNCKC